MYLRIQDNSIRFRISRDEASRLIDGEHLQDSLNLGPTLTIHYQIEPSQSASQFVFDQVKMALILMINSQALIEETRDRPSKQGIRIEPVGSLQENEIYLEVDVKKTVNQLEHRSVDNGNRLINHKKISDNQQHGSNWQSSTQQSPDQRLWPGSGRESL